MTTPDQHALNGPAQALLEAFTAISSDLDLRSVLTRIVEAATELTGARYGALGVVGAHDDLVEFVTTGLTPEEHARIGELPHGRGLLGLLIHEPEALRLHDLHTHENSAGFPAHHPPMTTFLGVPVRIRGTIFGNLYLTEKRDGEDFTEQDEQLVDALARAAGYVIENARAYGLSERRRQWLEASADLTEALQPPVRLGRALRQITGSARTISGARATAVLTVDDGDPERTVAVDDADHARLQAVLDTVAAGPQLDPAAPARETDHDGWQVLVIPLRAHLARPSALVAVFDSAASPHDVEERELLASFADQAALALDRAQAVADREDLAVISDRERIARDLHDVVIQRLFATGLQLQGIAMLAGSSEVAERLDASVDELDATIKAIRGTIFELQNKQKSSMRAELRALVQEYVPVLGFTPVVRTSGPVDTAVPDRVRAQLLPVLREAISNVARHALAGSAEIDLTVSGREVVLVVADDGVGLSADRTESGLRNARRRADDLGGSLEVSAGSPRGTVLCWRVPVHD